jgi:SAM-dependent methyltransferase
METNTIYDAYWQSGLHVTREWPADYFDKSFGVLKGKRCVLDYGCGFGYGYQRQLAGNVRKYIGADVSEKAVENARSKGFDGASILGNGEVDLEDATCDGAVCSEVFEHLWDPLTAAKELHRVLEPGGVLVATVPNFGYFAWRLLALLRAQVPLEPETDRYRGVHIRFFSLLMSGGCCKTPALKRSKCMAGAIAVSGMCSVAPGLWAGFPTGPTKKFPLFCISDSWETSGPMFLRRDCAR